MHGPAQDALGALVMEQQVQALQQQQRTDEPKQSYAFWETQPVAQFNDRGGAAQAAEVRRAPASCPVACCMWHAPRARPAT